MTDSQIKQPTKILLKDDLTSKVTAAKKLETKTDEAKSKKLNLNEKLSVKKDIAPANVLYTGRRKNAVARVMLKPGTGNVTINKLSSEKYFPRESHRQNLLKPLAVTKTLGQYDVFCTVKGGGHTGQSGAILLGIARALDKIDVEFRPLLKQDRLLTRDARVVERKKYGQRKARKSTQF